MKCKIN